MKRYIICVLAVLASLPAVAQKTPKWMDKARKAVVTVTAFDRDGRRTGSATGFYISGDGEGLSSYSVFNGASRATVTDVDGNTLPVAYVLGADDMYDVVRFKVKAPKKVEFLSIAADPAPVAGEAFLLLYSGGKTPSYKESKILEAGKLKDGYNYYKLSTPIEKTQTNAPWLLPTGQVFALSQEDESKKKDASYGLSASFGSSLLYTSVDAFNMTYSKIGIRKAWPSSAEDASVSLFLASSSQDAAAYLETVNDFIASFPDYDDGYVSRASHYATRYQALSQSRDECLRLALADLGAASKISKNRSYVMYRHAQLIYTVATTDSTLRDDKWSLAAASAMIAQALKEEELPAYRMLEGDINFAQQNWQAAHDAYVRAEQSDPSAFYMAARSLENIPGAQISDIIALLDSVIVKLGKPTPKEAAQYVLERVDYKMQLEMFKEAIEDYDLYYDLTDGKVNDRFFYFREQAKSRTSDNEGALADIREAIRLNPQAAEYYAEETAIHVRLQKYDEALKSIARAIEIDPDFAACYRLQGVCLARTNKKDEACRAFNRAKELGDPLVARLIREHCQQ